MKQYVIGLTGGIACGKSNLSAALKAAGARVVDADEISRALTAKGGPALGKIREAFGDEVFAGEELDRQALSRLVFSDGEAIARLNAVLHPLIFSEMRRQMAEAGDAVVLDVPLLYETGLDRWCDEVWCAYVPKEEQIARLRCRGSLTRREALSRIHSQMPAREKAKRADRVIRTAGTKEESAEAALLLWRETLQKINQPQGDR